MVEYSCPTCKIFKQNTFIAHTKHKKKPCLPLNDNENLVTHKSPQNPPKIPINPPEKNICMYCNKKYTRSDHLKRHIRNNCKEKKKLDAQKEKIFINLLEKDNLLKKKDDDIQKLCEQTNILLNKIRN